MWRLLFSGFLLCSSCSQIPPPTEREVKGLLANSTEESTLIKQSTLEGFQCHLSEADDAAYECEFTLAGVRHKHFYVRVGGKWQMVYEEGVS